MNQAGGLLFVAPHSAPSRHGGSPAAPPCCAAPGPGPSLFFVASRWPGPCRASAGDLHSPGRRELGLLGQSGRRLTVSRPPRGLPRPLLHPPWAAKSFTRRTVAARLGLGVQTPASSGPGCTGSGPECTPKSLFEATVHLASDRDHDSNLYQLSARGRDTLAGHRDTEV